MKQIKILSSNGIDENIAIVLNDYDYERQRAYYERNREKLTQYYHDHYLENKKEILQKKKEYNQRPEVKARSSEYHKNYYLQHKEELKLKHKEYSKNRNRKEKKK